jgi:hypothetical protein
MTCHRSVTSLVTSSVTTLSILFCSLSPVSLVQYIARICSVVGKIAHWNNIGIK